MVLFQNTLPYNHRESWQKMGNKAQKMLIDRLELEEEEENYKTEVIETHLVPRESTN
jgi:LacI family transcriptional regulator